MRALVLAGGGCKGAYQAGAIQHLMGNLGIDYGIICGTSVGAINAAFLAQTKLGRPQAAAKSLFDLWYSVSTEKVRKSWPVFGPLSALWKQSVYDSSPVHAWIRSGLDEYKIQGSGRKLRLVSVGLGSGEVKVADETTPNIADWVIASSAFPVMLSPIAINGDLWVDGGVRRVTPLGQAIEAGATDVDVIMCSDPFAPSKQPVAGMHALQILLRTIDIMNDEVSRADLQTCGLKNDIAQRGGKYKYVNVRTLFPSTPITVDSLDFDHVQIENMMNLGYLDAIKVVKAWAHSST